MTAHHPPAPSSRAGVRRCRVSPRRPRHLPAGCRPRGGVRTAVRSGARPRPAVPRRAAGGASSRTPRRSSMRAPLQAAGRDRRALRRRARARRDSTCARSWSSTSSCRGRPAQDFRPTTSRTMEQHIRALWPALTRAGRYAASPQSSLIPLPQPVRRARRPLPRGLLLGFVLHHARPGRERADGSRAEHARQLRAPGRAPSGTSPTAIAPTISAAASRRTSPRWSGSTRRRRTPRRRCATSTRSRRSTRSGWRAPSGSRRGRRTAASLGCATARCSTATGTTFRSRGPSRTVRTTSSGQTVPDGAARGVLPQHARGGGERVGLLQPLDARSEGSAHAGDDRPRAGGPQQPALPRRADDRRAARASAAARATPRSRARFDARGRDAPARAARRARTTRDSGFFYDVRWRTGAARDRPADAGRRGAALLRAGDAGAGARGGGAARARLPPAGRVRHDADRLRAAVGRA